MYAELKLTWGEIKDAEQFTRTIYLSGTGKLTYIDRAVIDWKKKVVYETYQEAEAGTHKDTEWTTLQIKRVYGPYSTEASIRTAVSKIKAKLRKNQGTLII